MAKTTGSIGESESPAIRIQIAGAFPNSALEFEATVDTGFTGFVSMPIMTALPLGLPLYGTIAVQFGDGYAESRFTGRGTVSLAGESQEGEVILEPSATEVLVGMDFLRSFQKSVIMHRELLILIDESDLDDLVKAVFAATER